MRIRTHVLSRQFAFVLWPALLLCAVGFAQAQQVKLASVPVFRITVVDEETGRGIPAVMLKMTNTAEYWTDNNGVIAFMEPDLMNQRVHFEVGSHGYKTPELGGGWG